ncbi:acyl-CoA thioesterase [Selenomonas bovis]|uniref:Acyl-CoA thioesterase n=1 Tax=Selenomonas bovis TaxID=416586 RepID=A0A848B2L4_9FIRM|nr:acyl-CoA thioesterase [Selenomonas bovis]MCI7056620.1 acyl-CoA thioesterase [Selenomonas bovis]NMD98489.1 acyl-CoA thioesterase [Selenomonas bovis]
MSENNRIVISQVMMPSQANPNGNVHGGEIMKMMDSTAYAAARKYARSNVVTARVDELEFHQPILIGDLVTCTADIVFVGHSSMEIAVNVEVEDLDHEGKPQKALSAYFTMVALDRNSRPKAVPPLILDTDEAREAFEAGRQRYEHHKQLKKREREAQKARDLAKKTLREPVDAEAAHGAKVVELQKK